MNLSKDLIYYQISQKYHARYLNVTKSEIKFSCPIFFTGQTDLADHTVMIDFHQLAQQSRKMETGKNLFICTGKTEESISITASPIILIEDHVSSIEVFNELQEIFCLFNTWDMKLRTIYYENGSFSDIINCCDPVIYDPISLSDNAFHYIGFSKTLSQQRGLVAALVDENDNFPMPLVNTVITSKTFSKKNKGIYVTPPVGDIPGNVYNKNIFYHDEYVGCLHVKVDGQDEYRIRYTKAVLEHLCLYTSMLYEKYQSFNQRAITLNNLRKLLRDSMNQDKIASEQLKKSFIELKWNPADKLQLVQFKPHPRYDKEMYIDYFCIEIEKTWRGCAGFEFQGNMILLVNRDKFHSYDNKEFFQALAYFLRDNLLVAGVSRAFNELSYLPVAFQQTNVAIHYGMIESPTRWYFNFNDYVLSYIMKNCTGQFEVEHICSEKLLRLIKHDKDKNTEYFLTLETYFQCMFNSTETAKKLFIQRSTFLYRMDRIKKLVNIDFCSYKEILYLAVSFQLLELE